MNLCGRGEPIDGCIFRDYFKISANPSTPITCRQGWGQIFNQSDSGLLKKYCSKMEPNSSSLKSQEEDNFFSLDRTRPLMEVEMWRPCGEIDAVYIVRPVECDIQCQ